MRVAVARLVKKGVLKQHGRGVYQLGNRGDILHRRVQAWHRVEEQLTEWNGRWLGVLSGHLMRSDKSALRSRERALRLKGFAAAAPGLAVRPANLRPTLAEVRSELLDLGLDREALVVGIDAADPDQPFDPAALWDTAGLEKRYRSHIEGLAASVARLPDLDVQSAARETLLLGRAVMRDVLVDPLLPEALIDAASRRRMIAAMVDYDVRGKACWRAFYGALAT
jgi:phenylacetic acid degradation operon negative regulatory protein